MRRVMEVLMELPDHPVLVVLIFGASVVAMSVFITI